jgi:hypothetical protein
VFAGIGAQLPVDLLDQTDLIDDASHDAKVIDVSHFDLWRIPLVHASQNISTC